MLRGLRKASSNWLGKTIMALVVGFLVLSFTIWGINDMFRGYGRNTVATIGSSELGVEQFRQIYNDRLQEIGRQLNRQLTFDQAHALGIDRQVIGQLIGEMALDERARQLRLGVSDAEIAKKITADPTFKGANGQFDSTLFQGIIRQAGFTEARYVAEQRKQMLRRQLADTYIGVPILPKVAVEAANLYQNEQRSIEYVLLDHAQAGDVQPPSPEVLAQYFEEHKADFRAPEYRKLVMISLTTSELAKSIEVSDADLKSAYEERKERYGTPERRQIQQIVFPSADDAKAAADRIGQGTTFDAIATERGLADKDIDLGTLTKAAIIDRAVADAAFALKEGEVSAPVKGRFGVVLLRVVKIEPAKIPSFEELTPTLKTDIANERAKADVLSLYDKIEDERSLGKSLTETATDLKISSRTVDTDRVGHDAQGNAIADLPNSQQLLPGAFSTDIGVENDPLQVDGGYVWFEITDITPARDRALDEVKDQVESRWREDEIAARLKIKAADVIDKLKGGTTFADLAAEDKLTVETKTGVKRGAANPPLSAQAIDVIFASGKEVYLSAPAATLGDQVVLRVTDIVDPPLDPSTDQAKQVEQQLNRSALDDVFAEFLAQIEQEVGVTINQAALRQVITGSAAPPDDDN